MLNISCNSKILNNKKEEHKWKKEDKKRIDEKLKTTRIFYSTKDFLSSLHDKVSEIYVWFFNDILENAKNI